MKRLTYLVAVLLLCSMSGCLFVEKIETRVRFVRNNKSEGQAEQALVTIVYHNVSSDAKNAKDLQKDFEELLKGEIKEGAESETEDGMIFKKRDIYIENGKINARAEAVPEDGKIEDVIANGERLLVLERNNDVELVETNGKVLKTEENYIIVWPESLEEIYWIQRFRPENDSDKVAIERNRSKLVQMLAERLKSL